MKEAQKREQELEKLRPEQVNCVALRTQLEKKFKEIDDLKEKLKEDNQKLKQTNEELELLGEVMHAFSARDDVFQMDNLNTECKRVEKSVEDFQKQVLDLFQTLFFSSNSIHKLLHSNLNKLVMSRRQGMTQTYKCIQ